MSQGAGNFYLGKAALASRLDMAESTVDEMVRRGVLPRPVKLSKGCVRWSWAAVEQALAFRAQSPDDADPFLAGIKNAQESGRKSA